MNVVSIRSNDYSCGELLFLTVISIPPVIVGNGDQYPEINVLTIVMNVIMNGYKW